MAVAHYVDLTEVDDVILNAWHARQPFSLVRFGDGENTVLRWPNIDETRMRHVLVRAMKDRAYTRDEIRDIQAGMVKAAQSADILGLYDSYEPNDLCVMHEEELTTHRISGKITCNPSVHFYLQASGFLAKLLESAERVTIISGRDVADRVSERFPNLKIDLLHIPAERQFLVGNEEFDQHYPDAYLRVLDAIRPEGPGHLYIVGAGLLGKYYCHVAKRRGGFALDIGSVLDYWAGVPSREGAKRVIEGGKVTYEDDSRWPGLELFDAPQLTALMQSPHSRTFFRPHSLTPRPC